jgi:peroxiredoxin
MRTVAKGWLARCALAMAISVSLAARAELDVGAPAPDFTTQASLGGNEFTFSLADALKKGPVVVYFYPAAFTPGCTVEAHLFAEATDDFQSLGSSVIGISGDDIATLKKFSVSECRSKFPVASDKGLSIAKSYDATMALLPGHASRTSYVVTPDGRITYAYSAMSPKEHVSNTLDAVKQWRAANPQ